jgi:hypothetical protein
MKHSLIKKNYLKRFHNLRNTRKCIPYISSMITFDMYETNLLLCVNPANMWGALGHVTHVTKPVTIHKQERDEI